MVRGYTCNLDAARAVLPWLTAHHDTDPVIVGTIRGLTTTLDTQHNTDRG